MIKPDRPLEVVNEHGIATSARALQIELNVVLIVQDPVRDGDRVIAFRIDTGERCDNQGNVSPCAGNLRLRNRMRRVWVNFYEDGSAFSYDSRVFAEGAANKDGEPALIAAAVPVDLPL